MQVVSSELASCSQQRECAVEEVRRFGARLAGAEQLLRARDLELEDLRRAYEGVVMENRRWVDAAACPCPGWPGMHTTELGFIVPSRGLTTTVASFGPSGEKEEGSGMGSQLTTMCRLEAWWRGGDVHILLWLSPLI